MTPVPYRRAKPTRHDVQRWLAALRKFMITTKAELRPTFINLSAHSLEPKL
jgi:hypothetical protein